MTLLTPAVKELIGREVSYTAPEELGRAAIRYFALAVGDENPLYVDDGYAKQHGYPSVIAPPTLICETSQYMRGPRNGEGLIGHWWDIPVEGARAIRGGNAYEFVRSVLPTDVITATWRIADITEREGSDGTPMLFVQSEATYTNQDGELLATNRETIIYRSVA